MTDFEPPRVIDPNYLQHHYLLMLAEVEDLFGQLRNAPEGERLEMIEFALAQSDGWIDHYYALIGVDSDMRIRASEIEMALIERLQNLFHDRNDIDLDE